MRKFSAHCTLVSKPSVNFISVSRRARGCACCGPPPCSRHDEGLHSAHLSAASPLPALRRWDGEGVEAAAPAAAAAAHSLVGDAAAFALAALSLRGDAPAAPGGCAGTPAAPFAGSGASRSSASAPGSARGFGLPIILEMASSMRPLPLKRKAGSEHETCVN